MKQPKGIYLAGADKDAGKTTLSLGLLATLNERLGRGAAFMKPIGQKSAQLDGTAVGQDSYLIEKALHLGLSLRYTAPFVASSGSAEDYLATGKPGYIARRILRAYHRLAAKHDLVVVEGTGHPGVGAVFDLSNAAVAAQLGTPVLLIIDGGIGSTIDRFTLCRALFQQENVPILGVIMNRVLPAKMDKVRAAVEPWFRRQDVPIFGWIPYNSALTKPSLGVLNRELKAETLHLANGGEAIIADYVAAFENVETVMKEVVAKPDSILLVHHTRGDVMDALLARKLAGTLETGPRAVILCGTTPDAVSSGKNHMAEACQKLGISLFQTDYSPGRIASMMHHKIYKVEPEESVKIREIIKLVGEHVDVDAILERLEILPGGPRRKGSIFRKLLALPWRKKRREDGAAAQSDHLPES